MLHRSGAYAAGMRTESFPKNPCNEEKKGHLSWRSMFVSPGLGKKRREDALGLSAKQPTWWASRQAWDPISKTKQSSLRNHKHFLYLHIPTYVPSMKHRHIQIQQKYFTACSCVYQSLHESKKPRRVKYWIWFKCEVAFEGTVKRRL